MTDITLLHSKNWSSSVTHWTQQFHKCAKPNQDVAPALHVHAREWRVANLYAGEPMKHSRACALHLTALEH
jgi:D-alanyl-D-alanine dipeptidase